MAIILSIYSVVLALGLYQEYSNQEHESTKKLVV